jgi:hypothetical protein
MGLGDHAEVLFQSLPGSEDGHISYMELIGAAKSERASADSNWTGSLRAFITAMAWDATRDTEWTQVELGGWSFSATDPEGVRRHLAARLPRGGHLKLSQVFEAIDENADNLLSKPEFVRGFLARLGFDGESAVLEQVFDEVDDEYVAHHAAAVERHTPPIAAADITCTTTHTRHSPLPPRPTPATHHCHRDLHPPTH